jgi:hypothetical protein
MNDDLNDFKEILFHQRNYHFQLEEGTLVDTASLCKYLQKGSVKIKYPKYY